ncbi:MAG: translation initiation factor IF-3 [Alteromonas naphthalenivorans]|jgi:translation initiation factor IF-3
MRKGSNNPQEDKKSGNGATINEAIRAREVQLITESGENLGAVPRDEALDRAQSVGLDLVMLSDGGGNGAPIVKIMDYGKELYNRKKKQAEAKKTQTVIQIKEVKIRPKIGEHDYKTKMNQAFSFLRSGKRVKFTLFFRGREMATRYERGTALFQRIQDTLAAEGLLDNLVQEKEMKAGPAWSKIYYIKKA